MRLIEDLLTEAHDADASDVHISQDRPPYFRINGVLKAVTKELLTAEESRKMIDTLIEDNTKASEELKQKLQTDFAYASSDGTRFRSNIFYRMGRLCAILRIIPKGIRTVEQLHLPSHILQFAEQKQGFVLTVGPAGHGKSTTLAALIEHVNEHRNEHIITIEDPVEYQFVDKHSIVDQREVGHDAHSFIEAIRATLRQDPNIIMIGELRDLESMQTAITLAETGHLVFTSLHTNNAAQTIERIVDSFPAAQQAQIRSQLASAISGVISQRLLPWKQGGRIPAVEIMVATTAIRNSIRENTVHQIPGIIQTSSEVGMQTLDSSLQALIDAGEITIEDAKPYFSSTT